jgi:2-oxoisovalerate dehydrogenase E2 component (dihydrolipoyl transacylase)
MSGLQSFRLPEVGGGLTEAEILHWAVTVGDRVELNQVLVEIETVKAAVELPSPWAGTVTALLADPGQTVAVGAPIISIDTGGPGGQGGPGEPERDGDRPVTLVGYGPRQSALRRSRPAEPGPGTVGQAPWPPGRPLAKPPVRKLAKDLGIDLRAVTASGPEGTITRDDVRAAQASGSPASSTHASSTQMPSTHAVAGVRETRVPVRGVRKHTAAAMVRSAFTAPHVTEFVTVDVSAMVELKHRVAARPEFAGVKLSPLVFVARALLLAIARTPEINARWDDDAQEIVLKHYVNLGIAAATDRGLLVPNLKDAHQLSLRELAVGISELASAARLGSTTPQALTGGTITITNVGVWGIDTGTPILNPGEAAILAVGAIRRQPWVTGAGADERIEPRWVTQLALSFDHRLVDGQQGSQALSDVAALLADPALAIL